MSGLENLLKVFTEMSEAGDDEGGASSMGDLERMLNKAKSSKQPSASPLDEMEKIFDSRMAHLSFLEFLANQKNIKKKDLVAMDPIALLVGYFAGRMQELNRHMNDLHEGMASTGLMMSTLLYTKGSKLADMTSETTIETHFKDLEKEFHEWSIAEKQGYAAKVKDTPIN